MTEFCIFDLDGTLLDTLEDLAVSVNYALEKNGLPQHPIDSYRYFVGDGVLTLIRRASGSGDEGLVKALKADFDRYYNVHRFDRTRPYDGARELLEALAKRNIPAVKNYLPLARAEVEASGLRPSFFLPMLHRQAPVFHRLGSIYR